MLSEVLLNVAAPRKYLQLLFVRLMHKNVNQKTYQQNFFSSLLTNGTNKLDRLSLACQSSLMYCLPVSPCPPNYSTFQAVTFKVGSGLTRKHQKRLERPVKAKSSCLFGQLVRYEEKKFCEYGACWRLKNFFCLYTMCYSACRHLHRSLIFVSKASNLLETLGAPLVHSGSFISPKYQRRIKMLNTANDNRNLLHTLGIQNVCRAFVSNEHLVCKGTQRF